MNKPTTPEEMKAWVDATWERCQSEAWAEKQEPVAFINVEKQKLEWAKLTSWHTSTIVNLPKIPLYTAPPQRTWVGLTVEEISDIAADVYGSVHHDDITFGTELQIRIKEKNT